MTSTVQSDELAEPSASEAPTRPITIIDSTARPVGGKAAPRGAAPAPDMSDAAQQVMTDLAQTPIAYTVGLGIPFALATIHTRRSALATEIEALETAQERDSGRLNELYATADDQHNADTASESLREALDVRAVQLAQLTDADSQLATGRVTLEAQHTTLTYHLDTFLRGGNADDLDRRIGQQLSANPLFVALADAHRSRAAVVQSVCRELNIPVPAQYRTQSGSQPHGRVMQWHAGINAAIMRRSPFLGRLIGSPFVLLLSAVMLVIAVFLFGLAGATSETSSPASATAMTTTSIPTRRSTTAPAFPTSSGQVAAAGLAMAYFDRSATFVDPLPTFATDAPTTGAPMTPIVRSPTTPTRSPRCSGSSGDPHSIFYAPSQLAFPAFSLTLPVDRARTQEIRDPNGCPQVKILPPQPGEVTHYGAYPGELGTLWLFGSQQSLSPLRNAQVKDVISLTDRQGAIYSYEVLPFSASGQPERVIDLTTDAWLFDAPADVATLIILVPLPKPRSTPTSGSATAPDDDFSTSQRLAYRAALVRYTVPGQTPAGTPVVVPPHLYTPQPGTMRSTTPTQTASITDTPASTAPRTGQTPQGAAPQTSSPSLSATAPPPLPSSTALPGLPDTGGAPPLSPISDTATRVHNQAAP